MPLVTLVPWSTRSPDGAVRRAGYSLHADDMDVTAFLKTYVAGLTRATLGVGRFPDGPAQRVVVNEALAAKVESARSLFYDEGNLTIEERMPMIFDVKEPPARNFIELCLAKKVAPTDVEDFVDHWNTMPEPKPALRDYLGMTSSEFAAYRRNAESLYKILFDRMPALPVS